MNGLKKMMSLLLIIFINVIGVLLMNYLKVETEKWINIVIFADGLYIMYMILESGGY